MSTLMVLLKRVPRDHIARKSPIHLLGMPDIKIHTSGSLLVGSIDETHCSKFNLILLFGTRKVPNLVNLSSSFLSGNVTLKTF
jgi:hypothetical protein